MVYGDAVTVLLAVVQVLPLSEEYSTVYPVEMSFVVQERVTVSEETSITVKFSGSIQEGACSNTTSSR